MMISYNDPDAVSRAEELEAANGRYILVMPCNDLTLTKEDHFGYILSDDFCDWMDARFGNSWEYWCHDLIDKTLTLFVPDEDAAAMTKLLWGGR